MPRERYLWAAKSSKEAPCAYGKNKKGAGPSRFLPPAIAASAVASHRRSDVILKEGVKAGTPFLQKPFTPSDLANKVRAVLDSQGRSQRVRKA